MDGFFDDLFGKKKKKKADPVVKPVDTTQQPALMQTDKTHEDSGIISKQVLGITALFVGGAFLFWYLNKRK